MEMQEIERFDPQKMYQVYDKWAILARDAYNEEFSKIQFEGPKSNFRVANPILGSTIPILG